MLYVAHLSIPGSTSQALPLSVSIAPAGRWITQIEIEFPPNTTYNVGVRLLDRASQFAPAIGSNAQWIRGDDERVTWRERFELTGSPYELRAEGYNTNVGQLEVEVRVNVSRHDPEDILHELRALRLLLTPARENRHAPVQPAPERAGEHA